MEPMPDQESFTLSEVADLLRVSQRTVRRWIHQGNLHAELRPGSNGPQYFVEEDQLRRAAQRIRRPRLLFTSAALNDLSEQLSDLMRRADELRALHDDLRAITEELLETGAQLHQFRHDLATWRGAHAQADQRRLTTGRDGERGEEH